MKNKFPFWCKRLASEDGVYIIEASIIIPVVFYCSLTMLFFAILMYQNVMSSHAATLAAERGAAFWDNSHKNAKTGSYPIGQHDRLYWRLFEDHMLDRLLGIVTSNVCNVVSLPVDGQSLTLPEKKLMRAGRFLPPIFRGEIKFHNTTIERKVTVSLDRPLYQTAFNNLSGRKVLAEGEAVAAIVEPVEFIRSIELVRYMTTKLNQWNKKGISKERVTGTLKHVARSFNISRKRLSSLDMTSGGDNSHAWII